MAVADLPLPPRTGAKMTCMMTPQFTYTDEEEPDGENVTYYLKRLEGGARGGGAVRRQQGSGSCSQKKNKAGSDVLADPCAVLPVFYPSTRTE